MATDTEKGPKIGAHAPERSWMSCGTEYVRIDLYESLRSQLEASEARVEVLEDILSRTKGVVEDPSGDEARPVGTVVSELDLPAAASSLLEENGIDRLVRQKHEIQRLTEENEKLRALADSAAPLIDKAIEREGSESSRIREAKIEGKIAAYKDMEACLEDFDSTYSTLYCRKQIASLKGEGEDA